MDIEYLLFLQTLRNALGGSLDEIFNGISKVAVDVMPLLPAIIYWCVSKSWGKRFLTTLWGGEVVNGLVKLTVCAYRPWIRSSLIEPAGDSKVAATGYSFPSGHTMCATTIYGTLAVWQYKTKRWISVICGVLIFLTMFSRNFLGVHTPQDVLCGFAESCLIIFVVGKILSWADGDSKRADILSIIAIVIIIASLIYIQVKPYPMDYVDGELLVDPLKMMKDCFKGCGSLLGVVAGLWLDRNYIHYEIPEGATNLPIVTAFGTALLFSWNSYFGGATVILMFGRNWGNFVAGLIAMLFTTALFPIMIGKLCGDYGKSSAKA